MREGIRMIVVLTLICTVCGAALSSFRSMTAGRIEYQTLVNVQGPKVERVLQGSDNDLIADRRKVAVDGEEALLFIGKKGGRPWAVAYETTGKGFGGDMKVMVGYDIERDRLAGIQIITHKETPGIGAKVTERPFTQRFEGRDIGLNFALKNDGGSIDAITGATYSSRGVCEAIRKGVALYPEVKKRALAASHAGVTP